VVAEALGVGVAFPPLQRAVVPPQPVTASAKTVAVPRMASFGIEAKVLIGFMVVWSPYLRSLAYILDLSSQPIDAGTLPQFGGDYALI
jgi:hypothetical protein